MLHIYICVCVCVYIAVLGIRNSTIQYFFCKKYFEPDPLHGSVGTFAVWATIDEAILSPKAHMAYSGGPVIKEKDLLLSL